MPVALANLFQDTLAHFDAQVVTVKLSGAADDRQHHFARRRGAVHLLADRDEGDMFLGEPANGVEEQFGVARPAVKLVHDDGFEGTRLSSFNQFFKGRSLTVRSAVAIVNVDGPQSQIVQFAVEPNGPFLRRQAKALLGLLFRGHANISRCRGHLGRSFFTSRAWRQHDRTMHAERWNIRGSLCSAEMIGSGVSL